MSKGTAKELGFFLDGKKKTQRTWTESDATGLAIIVASGNPGLNDVAFGFSSSSEFEIWLAKNGFATEYAKGQALLNRSPKELKPEKAKQVSSLQAKAVTQ